MKTRKTMLTGLALLLAFILAAPALVQAGRGHHGHHHHGHGHHHGHHHHHLGGGYYAQPRGYYRPYYPQPQYNYNYYPAPVYGFPPQMMMGIGTGNTSFMIRF
jgi:hypothetical protein